MLGATNSRAVFTVLLADNQPATRAGVRRALEAEGLRVVAEAANAVEAVTAASEYRPDVCLLSVRMPGNGIVAAEQIGAALPATKIIMLTESERDEDLLGALRAGAVGYLLKTTSAQRLPYAIRGVMNGEAALPRGLMPRVLRSSVRAGGIGASPWAARGARSSSRHGSSRFSSRCAGARGPRRSRPSSESQT